MSEPKYNGKTNRQIFHDWFMKILMVEGQSCLIRDVLRNQQEALWEEWKKLDPYGFVEGSENETK